MAMRDNEIVESEKTEDLIGGTYLVRVYKCGCERGTKLADDGTETNQGFSQECTPCHYGDAGLPE